MVKDGGIFRFNNEKISIDRNITIKKLRTFWLELMTLMLIQTVTVHSSVISETWQCTNLIQQVITDRFDDSIMHAYEDNNAVLLVYARADTFAQIDKEGNQKFCRYSRIS